MVHRLHYWVSLLLNLSSALVLSWVPGWWVQVKNLLLSIHLFATWEESWVESGGSGALVGAILTYIIQHMLTKHKAECENYFQSEIHCMEIPDFGLEVHFMSCCCIWAHTCISQYSCQSLLLSFCLHKK